MAENQTPLPIVDPSTVTPPLQKISTETELKLYSIPNQSPVLLNLPNEQDLVDLINNYTTTNNSTFVTNLSNIITTAAVAAGSSTYVQYNSSGSFGADSGFTFDKVAATDPRINLGIEGSGNGGHLSGIDAVTTNTAGGYIVVEAGTGAGTGKGGALYLYSGSGNGSGTGDGANIVLSPGSGGGSGGINGVISLQSGYVSAVSTDSPAGGTTSTFDLTTANEHRITMPAGNITIAVSNATNGQKFIISLIQDSVGSRTVTWFTTIRWAGGVAPTLTTTANKRDTFGFICTSGSTYDGFVIGQNL